MEIIMFGYEDRHKKTLKSWQDKPAPSSILPPEESSHVRTRSASPHFKFQGPATNQVSEGPQTILPEQTVTTVTAAV